MITAVDLVAPRPLMIDLFSGLGGWAEGGMAEGYKVVGFDIERHIYGEARYPSQLVIQDVLTLHGSQFKGAALIVASPPCQEFSYMSMPWSKAKEKARALRDGRDDTKRLTALFDACFRIQREAIEASGHFIPLVVENVCGAQPWVGRSRWNFGSFHLWGDVPALMPMTKWAVKVAGAVPRGHRNSSMKSITGTKNMGGSWFAIGPRGSVGELNNARDEGVKQGGDWFNASQSSISRRCGSKSTARKAASAAIAKIPFTLSSHIARAWWPTDIAELRPRSKEHVV